MGGGGAKRSPSIYFLLDKILLAEELTKHAIKTVSPLADFSFIHEFSSLGHRTARQGYNLQIYPALFLYFSWTLLQYHLAGILQGVYLICLPSG